MAERSDSTFNAIEQEAIVLLAVWGMIGEMVNYLLFVKGDTTEDVQLRFNSTVHQRLFSILLVDFLSRPTPSRSNGMRSEEHTSELQSLMRISYAVFCLKTKKIQTTTLCNYN